MTETLIQIVIATVSVVVLVCIVAFLYKRQQRPNGLMEVIAYQHFGPRKGIAALKVGRGILLLAVTPTDLTLLETFKEGELDIDSAQDIDEKIKRLRRIKEEL